MGWRALAPLQELVVLEEDSRIVTLCLAVVKTKL